ncbi:2-oxoglutarate carboxylase small subunit [Gemmata obscuriglobus]|uniref:Pyruvate carboxylase n=1 Tax=Gemmata obscuriglobus TaxID=114 RepID=A0A2Z3H3F2_9BACT|nr:pyruvate carboxylase [Gemmata obscuriglobus]AWM38852.1 pyruvate carboxylase [Gemmata obscuriglobus]QEG28148.1 2-oxoglutarate carboxylase small subunit [Gemmata obscuriglobus]VTS05829.1 pyruvate carboxylase : Pyruvate carboxylase OS=Blastopirellula marina DSM 3645 GN=DSM3645_29761 PE=4 SV=1: CPSase_L_chain: CPSase_L_D2: Biotin_carb_C: HMGL-like: PYC_OADA: Biotin_lipoyl [Gemmata obscuriglobus UQM 2246]
MPDPKSRPFQKLLVANRSEIAIRVFRSAHELGIRTVAIYSHEDRFALHRFKADEAYQVGKPGEPIRSYLDIESIVQLAKSVGVDAIHPGYGFLSENAQFARACAAAGITFVGPRPEVLEQLGDKVTARGIAKKAQVPVLSGGETPLALIDEAHALAEKLGYPVIVKASMGGGGRGMRVVHTADKLQEAVESAQREAGAAFGIADVFLEKFVQRAKHIEVQLLGDRHGGLVHLFERDCSVQRRHQKVVELAPAPNLPADVRHGILDAALAVGRACGIDNASTVEFLYDTDAQRFYFIEVNPRIQVEHTVTEQVTGFDIVRSQILIASGLPLNHDRIGLEQSAISTRGFAIQCRVTTEDPANGFVPDYGRLTAYRSSGGPGIRLDAGTAFGGAVITPFYDSLLVKVTVGGLTFEDCATRMERCLQEFRVRGVKTNIPFLLNLIGHPQFLAGDVTTRFLDETPGLFQFTARRDRASKLLGYLADVIVNGHPELKGKYAERVPAVASPSPTPPMASRAEKPKGTRDRFKELGAAGFAKWTRAQKQLFVTDTTMRDAHQSLFATRMRTFDMLAIADRYAERHADLFSMEMWGGATFDTAMRFLKESPWDRLAKLRERVPNVLFQMLVRAASAVGYTNYPDNVVYEFIRLSAQAGMDIFRIFDANNWLPNIKLGIDAVLKTDAICEAAICYTGDILDPKRDKYTLTYFVNLAKELEKLGTHFLAIKDMAGLLKPYAAKKLVKALREEVGLPIHFHTHDSAGGQLASYLMAAEEGVSVVDCAFAPMAGVTSQPSLNALVEAVRYTDRSTRLDFDALQETATYWDGVRRLYAPFETGQLAGSAEVYLHEMPGGQYANLYQQAQSLGVADRWAEVGRMYAAVNRLFGDIVKVTPTSKVVGDMTLFMLANNLTPEMVLDPKKEIAFPESVVEFFEGKLGQPPGGFPPALQTRILRGRKPLTDRPGATLPPVDLAKAKAELEPKLRRAPSDQDVISYVLYPKVFSDFAEHQAKYSDVSVLPTPSFFFGLAKGEEVSIEIEPGKTLIIKFFTVGEPQPDGYRVVYFELNGQPREFRVVDRTLGAGAVKSRPKAENGNAKHIAAPMPGAVVAVAVAPGEEVAAGAKLLTLEAMKMETTIYADRPGKVAEVLVRPGAQVEGGDLVIRFE